MRELKRGQQLASRYTLERRLAAGGGRETWVATDRLTRASVALKIAVDAALDAGLLRREWLLSMRLVHAHIARVFEFHDEDDGPLYSLQFVDGPDIGVLDGAPPDALLPPIAAIADALAYAHGKGVVHRDIKASNVLLDANGAPYLIDFGVAARDSDHVGGGALIAQSPQQLAGEPPSPSDDVFALGGLIYELVSGRSPYSADATADDIRQREPESLARADGGEVATPLADLVHAMLAKDAEQRPDMRGVVVTLDALGIRAGNAPRELINALPRGVEEVIEAGVAPHRPAESGAPSVRAAGPEVRQGLSRRTVGIGFGALVLLLLAVVFVLPGIVERDSPRPVSDQPREEGAVAADPGTGDSSRLPQRDERVLERQAAEEVLGQLLAKMQTLEARAVQRWGGLAWKRTEEAYKGGDAAYLERDYARAAELYAEANTHIEPLLERVDDVFRETLAAATSALAAGDYDEAVQLHELAVAISPSDANAVAGLKRAKNLDRVLALTEQAQALERDLELEAARQSFARALEIDPEWRAARDGLARVDTTIRDLQFEARMSEGLSALGAGDYAAARAAFRRAQAIRPGAPEPADGLLQVDQEVRLGRIATLEQKALQLEQEERWSAAAGTYEDILELDPNLAFAKDGLVRANGMSALFDTLDGYIDEPDSLSAPRNMQIATQLVVEITRMPSIGPELAARRDRLSELLKRAATPLTVRFVSDNQTDVAIYKVGKLGTFETTEVSLRPGTYVAVGSRPGYRDVRLEFRVAPEIDMQPVVVRCEEKI